MGLQSLSLNSSLAFKSQHDVYRGENISFLCITRGSSILAWSSNEYINDRIEFLTIHSIGTVVAQNQYSSAQLIDVYMDDDRRSVIVSELYIVVQRNIAQSSVTCHHVGNELTKTITFQLSGMSEIMSVNLVNQGFGACITILLMICTIQILLY